MKDANYELVDIGQRPQVQRGDLLGTRIDEAGDWNPAVTLYGLITGQHGDRGPLHVHENAIEYMYTIAGEATVTVDGREVICRAGQVIIIGPDTEHPVRVTGENWTAISAVVSRPDRVS